VLRLVLDTNLLIAALIRKNTTPYLLYDAWRDHRYELITSQAQLQELERVMGYRKLQRYFSEEEARAMLAGVATYAECAYDLPSVAYSPDPDDNFILATAIAGRANYLVSGDKADVLALGKVGNIPIITAKRALELLDIA
jgi:uncharacterized protein